MIRLRAPNTIGLLLLIGLTFFWSQPGQAVIEILSVEPGTASGFKGIGPDKKSGDSPTIFGGTAGTIQCTGDDITTCNNCETDNPTLSEACNERQIYSTLTLKIRYKSDQKSGTTFIADSTGNQVSGVDLINPQNLAAGGEHVAQITWTNMCSTLLAISADCLDDGQITISVGVDGNGDSDLVDTEDDKASVGIIVQRNIAAQVSACDVAGAQEGLCSFAVFPGDEKVFLQDPVVATSFPQGAGPAQHVRLNVYGVEATLADGDSGEATFNSIQHIDKLAEFSIEEEDDGDLQVSPDSIDGLTNGQEYFFSVATVDEAGNVGFHTPTLRIDNGLTFLQRNVHSAKPEPVSGLLSEDFQCFIATAAYGSPFEKEVRTLRFFRNRFLKTHGPGRWLIQQYYRLSPPLAQQIAQRAWLRRTTRLALLPLIVMSSLALEWGWPFLTLLVLFPFFAVTATLMLLKKRREAFR